MRKTILIALISLFSMGLYAQIKIIPQPTSIKQTKGFYYIDNSITTFVIGNNTAIHHSLQTFVNILKKKK